MANLPWEVIEIITLGLDYIVTEYQQGRWLHKEVMVARDSACSDIAERFPGVDEQSVREFFDREFEDQYRRAIESAEADKLEKSEP